MPPAGTKQTRSSSMPCGLASSRSFRCQARWEAKRKLDHFRELPVPGPAQAPFKLYSHNAHAAIDVMWRDLAALVGAHA